MQDLSVNDFNKNNISSSNTLSNVLAVAENVENSDVDETIQAEEKEVEELSTELIERKAIVFAILIPFSIIGVLIRIGLINLHSYPGTPQGTVSLWKGLTTGFCGSITTFSSWILLIFNEYTSQHIPHRSVAYNVLASLADIGITIGMSVTGLKFGEHLADIIIPRHQIRLGKLYKIVQKPSKLNEFTIADILCLGFGIVSFILVVALASTVQVHRNIIFATVFAPIGTSIRCYLSKYNTLKKHFPLGTFAANLSGSIVLGILFLLSNGIVSSQLSCEIIEGLANGFCGCLTTISSFANEITRLPRKHAYKYALVSVLMGQVAMILTIGIYHWTIGLSSTSTCN
ncbi:2963_t:CDS:2 [Funneliformis geosporum]|uniref:2963_t:CDS:1 n=1 Tax=Funneliformis geosporum TaxID=1117311 RepID=A0A9W4SVT1_9GLOM|nr:2963_t:CDS:2 [Funneliformis geosporum]